MNARLQRLGDRLTVCRVPAMAYNAGVFAGAGEALVIDPGLDDADLALVAQAAGEQQARVTSVVLTHYHWDHVMGAAAFPEAEVVAQAESVAVAAEFGGAIARQVRDWRRESGAAGEFALPEPDATFEARLELSAGGEPVELLPAPGHAPEQLVVWHAGGGMLWAADMLSDVEIPFVMQSVREYRRTLDRLAALDIRALVPGHGSPTTEPEEIRRRFDDDRRYLAALAETVAAAVQAGAGAPETLARCRVVPHRLRPEQEPAHRLNVITAFGELGGRREPGVEGWSRLQ